MTPLPKFPIDEQTSSVQLRQWPGRSMPDTIDLKEDGMRTLTSVHSATDPQRQS